MGEGERRQGQTPHRPENAAGAVATPTRARAGDCLLRGPGPAVSKVEANRNAAPTIEKTIKQSNGLAVSSGVH
jgi:hypothetical protein